jgi:hypothetical protein
MSTDHQKFRMRLDGAQYLALPEAHRNTLVVGMVDMLEVASTRLIPSEIPRIQRILEFAQSLKSEELRELLDRYLRSTEVALQYAIASNLIAAIGEKS